MISLVLLIVAFIDRQIGILLRDQLYIHLATPNPLALVRNANVPVQEGNRK